jgi:16S rRNA (cytidine1402-2'-O)-methyltransferase
MLKIMKKEINELLEKIDNPKGEFVILIEKAEILESNNLDFLNNLSLDEHYNFYAKQNLEKNEIIKRIAKDRNVKKNEIYKEFI